VEVVVLAPAAPGIPCRARVGDVTVVRYRYFLPERLQRLSTGEGIVSTMERSLLARAQAPLLVGAQWAVLRHIVRTERIDVVNAHWLVPQGLVAASWRRGRSPPLVVTAHGGDVALLGRLRAGASLLRFILDRTDVFLPVSRALGARVEELVGRPVARQVIPMGVSPSLFEPRGDVTPLRRHEGERVVVFVGKLGPTKGVRVLLEAVAMLRARGNAARLAIFGRGVLEAEIRARAHALGLSDAVDMRGWVENRALPGVYRGADVVCLPSVRDARGETEGTPVVLLEALAVGALVVASEIAGIPDIVRDGVSARLVAPGDARALCLALEQTLNLASAERAKRAAAARDAALSHSWEQVAIRYLRAFEEARGETRRREDARVG
jgi:glycosyltransferase involved in cell wall biosynthesis